MRRLIAGLAAALAVVFASEAGAAPAMWAVKDKDSTIYLFGSMHILEPGVQWRTRAFDAAYARSTTLWFETDNSALTDKARMNDLVQRFGLDEAHPLSGKLGADDLAALKATLAAAGIPEAGMERLRPWIAALVLTILPYRRNGFDSQSGADAVVSQAAAKDKKTIRAFETVDASAHLLADLPEPVQIQLLQDALQEKGRPVVDVRAIQAACVRGDLVKLGPLLVEDMRRQRPELYEALIHRRNGVWADALAEAMKGAGVQMVEVGALHMVGDEGLPALMRARGIKVVRVH
jgi:uncharacterized protein YbaP (TraB family)